MRASAADLRDVLFDQRVNLIAGPRSGLTVALLRRIGWKHGIMADVESLVEEFSKLVPRGRERVGNPDSQGDE